MSAPDRPTLVKRKAIFADSAATRRSQAQAIDRAGAGDDAVEGRDDRPPAAQDGEHQRRRSCG